MALCIGRYHSKDCGALCSELSRAFVQNQKKQNKKKEIFSRILLIPKNTSDPVNLCSVCLRLCYLYAIAFICVLALLLGGDVLGFTLIPCLMEGCCVLVELLASTHTYSDSKASTNILDYYRFPRRMEGEVRTPACKLLETGTVE